MEKLEKKIMMIIFTLFVLFIVLSISISIFLKSLIKPISSQIEKGGLKSIVSEVWNGKGQK